MTFIIIYLVGFVITNVGMTVNWVSKFGDSRGEYVSGALWGFIGAMIWPVFAVAMIFAGLAWVVRSVVGR